MLIQVSKMSADVVSNLVISAFRVDLSLPPSLSISLRVASLLLRAGYDLRTLTLSKLQ